MKIYHDNSPLRQEHPTSPRCDEGRSTLCKFTHPVGWRKEYHELTWDKPSCLCEIFVLYFPDAFSWRVTASPLPFLQIKFGPPTANASWVKKKYGQDTKLQFWNKQCKHPTADIMCSQNFSFALKFPQNRAKTLAPNFACLDQNFPTEKYFRQFSDSPTFKASLPPVTMPLI